MSARLLEPEAKAEPRSRPPGPGGAAGPRPPRRAARLDPSGVPGTAAPAGGAAAAAPLPVWLRVQSVNVARHACALRPFKQGEFGTGPEAPTSGHLEATNALIRRLRSDLLRSTARVRQASEAAQARPETARLHRLLAEKERAHSQVRAIEKIWDFYFELFGQRQTRFGCWLLGCDRIALDCYQASYMGIGAARPIPAPPPFAYVRTGFSPATFRRGIPLSMLGRQLNPFPLVQLPYHRMVNPWTLGAVLHEVSHNLQNDLGLARAVPVAIARRLLRERLPRSVARTWARWNRELFADLCGLLLGGPPVVASLMDVVGRSPEATLAFNPAGVHPTPFLRTFLSVELLRRMGFEEEARGYGRLWGRLYPDARVGTLPRPLLDTFPQACALVVDTVCYQPYKSLGNKSLAASLPFAQKELAMMEEAAGRLAAGSDPGVLPERFLIGAVRIAVERRLARPGVLTGNFYKELARR
jgi:hypothetical protein